MKYKKYEKLSPFELKNFLIKLAEKGDPNKMLNAGRGNPNFYNRTVRRCFAHLQRICLEMIHTDDGFPNLSIYPLEDEMNFEKKLLKGVREIESKHDRSLLRKYINFIIRFSKLDGKSSNNMLHSLVISVLGCFYPSPPQIQPFIPYILEPYMFNMVVNKTDTSEKPSNYDFFLTEGAAAGILYIFNALHINKLLNKGDTIAIITPIFSPYIELPKLEQYGLKMVLLHCDPNDDYNLPETEINKLLDINIKALFMVNPSNPGAYALSVTAVNKIGAIVRNKRKDLIIVSDNVYAPFTTEYNSLMRVCPKNTIEIFSLSKYFGVTGWRLGIIMIRKNNIFNKLLRKLSKKNKSHLRKKYSIASLHPNTLTFMERVVLNSREVTEAHTGGLSTPQQVLLSMFIFSDMIDTHRVYKKEIQTILVKRLKLLYSELDYIPDIDAESTDYYSLINIPMITEKIFGEDARKKIETTHYLKFLFHIAKKYKTVLLPGLGFDAGRRYYRISLANLKTEDYAIISKNIKQTIQDLI